MEQAVEPLRKRARGNDTNQMEEDDASSVSAVLRYAGFSDVLRNLSRILPVQEWEQLRNNLGSSWSHTWEGKTPSEQLETLRDIVGIPYWRSALNEINKDFQEKRRCHPILEICGLHPPPSTAKPPAVVATLDNTLALDMVTCPICQDINSSILFCFAGHGTCLECVKKMVKSKEAGAVYTHKTKVVCPTCRAYDLLLPIPLEQRNILNHMEMQCPHKGCSHRAKVHALKAHTITCSFQGVKCLICKEKFQDIVEHYRVHAIKRPGVEGSITIPEKEIKDLCDLHATDKHEKTIPVQFDGRIILWRITPSRHGAVVPWCLLEVHFNIQYCYGESVITPPVVAPLVLTVEYPPNIHEEEGTHICPASQYIVDPNCKHNAIFIPVATEPPCLHLALYNVQDNLMQFKTTGGVVPKSD